MKFPQTYFIAVSIVNILNYIDRGIIPGASQEFQTFISNNTDTSSPSLLFGLLQSAFIVGFSISALVFGHLTHYYDEFKLIGVGLTIWVISVELSGVAYQMNNYTFLLMMRMMSGIGEGAFVTIVPPFIAAFGGKTKGFWVAIFYTAIPVGTAFGYTFGALMADSSLTVAGAFYLEGLAMLPFGLWCFFSDTQQKIKEYKLANPNHDVSLQASLNATSPQEDNNNNSKVSLYKELASVLSSPTYICLVAGYAAYTAVLIGIATFGSAFFLGIGLFDSQTVASTIFGVIVSTAGIIGTPIGGILIDKLNTSTPLLTRISGQLAVEVALGMLIMLFSTIVLTSNGDFALFLLWLGVTLLLMCTAGINLGIIASVSVVAYRPFAVGLSTALMHLLGDVPSPIVLGYLKDYLAPGCKGNEDDDSAASSKECRDDKSGLVLTIQIGTLWLGWAVLSFFAAYMYCKYMDSLEDKKTEDRASNENDDPRKPLLETRNLSRD